MKLQNEKFKKITNAWKLPLVKPKRLKKGDNVAVVSPSWGDPASFPYRYQAGKRQLEELFGLKVIEMPNALKSADWIKQNPQARADDLMLAFSDNNIKAIISSIGGDDSIRLIPYLDLDIITQNPKIFLGYSDTTALHFALLKAGLSSFYGPSIMTGFSESLGIFDYMKNSLHQTLFLPQAIGKIKANENGWTDEHLDWSNSKNQQIKRKLNPSTGVRLLQGNKIVRGHLIGGCAEVIEMIKGSAWWPPIEYWRGAILFYETSEEAPDPQLLIRWLRNFGAQGILQVLSAIIFARPGGNVPIDKHKDYDNAIIKALNEVGLDQLPVLSNLDFGHTDPIFTIPYGANMEINCNEISIKILDAPVS